MSERALTRAPAVGWHGKLPSRGDFVSGGARSALIEGWRIWAATGIAAFLAGEPGAGNVFLVAPVWRFACVPGFFAPSAGIGVMSPGTDRLGRLFPFIVAAELAELPDPECALATAEPWFAAIEPVVLSALDPGFDPVLLEQRLSRPDTLEPMTPSGKRLSDEARYDGHPSAVFVAAAQDRHENVHGAPGAALFATLFGPPNSVAVPADEPGSAP